MCKWCENGRLVRRTIYKDVDHSKYLHVEDNPSLPWLRHKREHAEHLVRVEEAKDRAAVRKEVGDAREARFDGEMKCLSCQKEISRALARKSGFCSTCKQRVMRWKKKWHLIERAGGVCEGCGWTPQYASQMDFHHIDPSTKAFNIGEGINLKYETLYEECDKCVLLCSNCHRGVEQGFNEEVYALYP